MSKYTFKITENDGVKNVIYQINKLEIHGKESYKIERVKSKINHIEGYDIKEFIMNQFNKELILLSIWDDKYIVNGGFLKDNELIVSGKPKGAKYTNVKTVSEIEYFSYVPSEERKILIIDLETAEELKEKKILENGVEHIVCELKPNKKYLALEFRFGTFRTVAVGICKFEKKDGKYYAEIDPTEARRIDYDLFIDSINKDISKKIPVKEEKEIGLER